MRKRNFSVPLPSERTLDIRDAKIENQLGPDQSKEAVESLLRAEDETRNPLFQAPAFTTFRSIPAKRNSSVPKSSDWIPLLPADSSESISHTPFNNNNNNTNNKRNLTFSQPPTPQTPSSTARTTLVVKRNLTSTHVPPTQDPVEISTLKSSSTARNDLSEVSTSKSSTTARKELSSFAESNISVQTTKPETSESSIPPFGSRTTTARITSPETTRSTTTLKSESSTPIQPLVSQETSSARSSTTASTTTSTSSPLVFGSRTTTPPSDDQTETSSSVKPVLNRPPVILEPTTRSKPHTTEPIKEEPVTTPSETTAKTTSKTSTTASSPTTTLETTGHVSRTRVRLRDSLIGRFQSNVTTAKSSSRSFARNLDEVNAPEDSNDKNLQLSRIVEGIIGVENETGSDKVPASAPLIAPLSENLNSDKRSSLVRSRTTASKFLTSTRRAPEIASPVSSTTTTTTTSTTTTTTESSFLDVLQEEVYSDKRLEELAHSGPDYPSTEREETFESETVFSDDVRDVTEVVVGETDLNFQQEPNTPVVERPAGLQKELLAAIRRKITQNRSNVTAATTTTTTTKPPSPTATTTTEAVEKTLPNTSFESNDVSPDSNIISSTQHPSFFKPIPFPSDQNRSGSGKDSGEVGSSPRVQFFVRVPNSKPGSQVKIPDISHIQGKLARLNAAITEGLQEQRKQQQIFNNSNNDFSSQIQEEKFEEPTFVNTTTTTSAISPTTEPTDEESLLVLTSTSVSSIFSVVTGSSQIKGPTTTTSSTTTTSTTSFPATTVPLRAAESVTPRLAYKDRIYETGTEQNVEATSKASSVSEIITIGKTELRNAESATEKPAEPPIAQKTYTYLDRLREGRHQPSTAPTASTTTTTTTTATSTTEASRTTTGKNKPVTTKKPQVRI